MVVVHHPQDLSADDEAALVAYVDGRLEPARRAEVEARAESDPSFAAALAHQQAGRDAVVSAAEATGAPLRLRTQVEAMGARGRRHGARGPSARTRLGGIRWPAGLAAGAVAAVLAAVVLVGGGPGIGEVAAAATRPPVAAIGPVPAAAKLLPQHVDDVAFPNYAGKFGWKAVGTRTDEIGGRDTRTVFYEKAGRRIGYTVVDGDALDQPGDATKATREGSDLWSKRYDGRDVVTWRRKDHTCVLSATGVPRDELLELAGWKGKGAVDF
jgi:anti-sigma factor RsiW